MGQRGRAALWGAAGIHGGDQRREGLRQEGGHAERHAGAEQHVPVERGGGGLREHGRGAGQADCEFGVIENGNNGIGAENLYGIRPGGL